MELKGEKGFTLIELILVIVILGIVGAIISLNFGGLDTIRLDNAAKKLVADLRYAQQLAITTGTRHGLEIDALLEYSLHIDNAGVDANISDPLDRGVDFIVNFDAYQQQQLSGVRFDNPIPFCGGPVIEFDNLGAPTDTIGALLPCTPVLALALSGNNRVITIQPNTGRITY